MKTKSLLLGGALLAVAVGHGQSGYTPRDTSYSIHSTYLKVKKDHPAVRPVYARSYEGVREDTNLVYASVEARRDLHLDVWYPKVRAGLRPGILMIHGGGWTTGSKENLHPMAQRLAAEGYVTVTPEYRLSAEAPYPAGVRDLKRAVRWMRAHAEEYGIDTSRIAAYGASAGAHLASLLGTTNELSRYDTPGTSNAYSDDVQAVLNIDGIVSFVHPDAEPEWSGKSANAWLGDYVLNYPRWREASPLEYVDEATPPFLFVNSSYPRFHAGREELIKKLNQYNTFSKVYTLENSPHGFWLLQPWFEPTVDHAVNFLREVFGPL
ncbi:acetyl esterase/lipase [Neolewinella xylanilytica]|uniref:Acetyl esterase/lipase n=1 Tax=Neolewinella xylanilytica TaxID=1514080 RepID=A0A2S6IB65_9BACT|nr:alpha/beta hydrolase [Neolewinella xylanilytica]PPK88753.1 acetyl esterase/lipase [Neolewinella xylanilytica]